jgi:hypothetical protein
MNEAVKGIYLSILGKGSNVHEIQIKHFTNQLVKKGQVDGDGNVYPEDIYGDHLVYQVFIGSLVGGGRIFNLMSTVCLKKLG